MVAIHPPRENCQARAKEPKNTFRSTAPPGGKPFETDHPSEDHEPVYGQETSGRGQQKCADKIDLTHDSRSLRMQEGRMPALREEYSSFGRGEDTPRARSGIGRARITFPVGILCVGRVAKVVEIQRWRNLRVKLNPPSRRQQPPRRSHHEEQYRHFCAFATGQ